MGKCLIYYLILGFLFTGCVSKNTNAIILENPQTSKTIVRDETNLSEETKLSKEIFILIGRGYCCSGHIISVSKNGEIKYFVGTYSISGEKAEMPETYDPQFIKPDSNYKQRNFKLSPEKIQTLEQLISNGENLRFKENLPVIDDYVYSIFLDNKKIASGAQSRKDKFPRNLKALIDLIEGEVKIYELPGMA